MSDTKKDKIINKDLNKLLKKWVHYDEEIKLLEEKLNTIKEKKKIITPILEDEFKNNNINKIMINSNYHLAYKDKEYYTPINRKYISKSLDNLIDVKKKN